MLKSKIAFILILLIALASRALFAGAIVGWQRAPFGDETDYHTLAENLSTGDGYVIGEVPVARRPPLYPVALSALYRIAGPKPVAGRIMQVILGGVLVLLVFFVTRRYFGERPAWIAMTFSALNPFLIFISGYLLTENLYTIFLLLALWVVPTTTQFLAERRWVLAAAIFVGLASLARPTAFAFGMWVVACVVLFGAGAISKRLVRSAVFMAVIVAILIPWAARNNRTFDKWIFFTLHGGTTFYQGNNAQVLEYPQYRGSVAPHYMLPRNEEIMRLPPLERDKVAWAEGKKFLRENKSKIPRLVWNKFARFWRFKSESGMSGIKSGWWFGNDSKFGRLATQLDAGFLYAMVVMPLFVLGLVTTARNYKRLLFLYGLIIAHTAIALLFHGSLRMRLPIEPIIAMFAAGAINQLVTRLRLRQTSAVPVE